MSSLYKLGSLKTVAKDLAKCELNTVGNTGDWDRDSPKPADDYTFFYRNDTITSMLMM
jgi:hypothetical protein